MRSRSTDPLYRKPPWFPPATTVAGYDHRRPFRSYHPRKVCQPEGHFVQALQIAHGYQAETCSLQPPRHVACGEGYSALVPGLVVTAASIHYQREEHPMPRKTRTTARSPLAKHSQPRSPLGERPSTESSSPADSWQPQSCEPPAPAYTSRPFGSLPMTGSSPSSTTWSSDGRWPTSPASTW